MFIPMVGALSLMLRRCKLINSLMSFNFLLDGEPVLGSSSVEPEAAEETTVAADSTEAILNRTNDLLSGSIFFIGILFGAIGIAIFFGRIQR